MKSIDMPLSKPSPLWMILYLFLASHSMGLGSAIAADDSQVQTVITGTAFIRKPVANGKIVVKNLLGEVIGESTTDSSGQFNIPASASGELFAELTTPAGAKFYGLGRSGLINVTGISDLLINQWYKAMKLNLRSSFKKLSEKTPVPNDFDLEALGQHVFTEASSQTGEPYIDVFHESLGLPAQLILANTISSKGLLSRLTIRLGRELLSKTHLKAVRTADAVTYSGVAKELVRTQKPTDRLTAKAAKAAKTTLFLNGVDLQTTTSQILATVNNARAVGPNETWMADDMQYIGNQRLGDIAIPGTHDAGSANIKSNAERVARTQDESLLQQLNGGVRYLDMRVLAPNGLVKNWDNSYGSRCPVNNDYYIFHNSIHNWYDDMLSYRLSEAMDQIKAFVTNPAHASEVVIIDFQVMQVGTKENYWDSVDGQPGYTQQTRMNYLLAPAIQAIQTYLDGYIIQVSTNATYKGWDVMTISDLIASNATSKSGAKVILLVDDGLLKEKPTLAQCGNATLNPDLWFSRQQRLNGYYGGRKQWISSQQDGWGIDKDVLDQLSQNAAISDNRKNFFDNYKGFQARGYPNQLNLAPAPYDGWYGNQISPFGKDDWLTNYSVRNVNQQANANYGNNPGLNAGDTNKLVCETGELGRYAFIGNNPPPPISAGEWNRANIIMVDNYQKGDFWITVKLNDRDQFTKASNTNLVSFVRNINNAPRVNRSAFNDMNSQPCLY